MTWMRRIVTTRLFLRCTAKWFTMCARRAVQVSRVKRVVNAFTINKTKRQRTTKTTKMKIGLQRDARASALNWIRVYWLCDSSSR